MLILSGDYLISKKILHILSILLRGLIFVFRVGKIYCESYSMAHLDTIFQIAAKFWKSWSLFPLLERIIICLLSITLDLTHTWFRT